MAYTYYSPIMPWQQMQPSNPYTLGQPSYQPQVQSPRANTINGRMVTSREEALGVPVDFAGGVTVMPDISHGSIYTKVFNTQTGNADFVEYRRVAPEQSVAPAPADAAPVPREEYVTKAQFDELCKEVESLRERKGGKDK